MDEPIRRIPPHDTEAEQAVLSCMLSDRDALTLSCEHLRPEYFYTPAHGSLFSVMSDLYAQNIPADIVTLSDRLKENGLFEQVGGMEYLSTLVGLFYTSANIKFYNDIIIQKALLRNLAKAGTTIADSAYKAESDVDVIIESAEKLIFDIAQNRGSSDFAHIKDALVESIERIEQRYKTKEKITGVPSGFTDLDGKTTGFQPSDLILIAARPSMGKTAFALNIAQNAAIKHNITTAVFSLEMSAEQVANRLLCSEAFLDAQKIRTGTLDGDDWMKLAEAMGSIANAPIYIDDTAGINVSQLRAKCRKLKIEKGLGLVVIDYLQLMSGRGRSESRQNEISEISRSLKAIARELAVPIIALSQLSRACESRTDHHPMLSDLRESGAIEQDADVVAFIYRDDYYNEASEKKGVAEIIIAKQRNGPTGSVELAWLSEYTKFASLEKNYM
ncbi:replicative DNA helicase [Clostridia bacterium]|nr:replicative DNA helicase [Clostridia bacterium]GHU74644.1 replicative DNA helicase [Clostridia bacterium]